MADATSPAPTDKGTVPTTAEPAAPPAHVGTAIPKAPEKSVNETAKPSAGAAEASAGPAKVAAPEHLTANEGDTPERKQAVEAAKKASDHPVTRPGTPGADGKDRRPYDVVAAELAEARAKLNDMIGGKNVAPETDEIKGQRETVDDLQRKLNEAKSKLDAQVAANSQNAAPGDLHAQHYAVKTLEDELKGANPAGTGARAPA